MNDWSISNVRAVLPDRVLDDATLVIRDGQIVGIESGGSKPSDAVDGRGLLAMPGLVDSHSDGLEREVSPRRTATFPLDFALGSFESRLRSSGITTVFHGIGYQEKERLGRSVSSARQMCDAIRTRHRSGRATVRHEILYRFEARDPGGVDPMLDDVEACVSVGLTNALVSFEDHTPGQGQFNDVEQYKAYLTPDMTNGTPIDVYVEAMMAEAETLRPHREANLDRLAPLAKNGEIRLVAHDLDSPEATEAAAEAGAMIAEFPTCIEAAATARAHGMHIVAGAPNVMRGTSASGNVSARELIEAELCDVVSSDYMPSALLASVFSLTEAGVELPRAVGLVTSGPAAMTGMDDVGRLVEGCTADVILVDDSGRWPEVVDVRRAGEEARWGPS